MVLRTINDILEERLKTFNYGQISLIAAREMRLNMDPNTGILGGNQGFDIKPKDEIDGLIRQIEEMVKNREFSMRDKILARKMTLKNKMRSNISGECKTVKLEEALSDAFYKSLCDDRGIGEIHAVIYGDWISVCTQYDNDLDKVRFNFFYNNEGMVYSFDAEGSAGREVKLMSVSPLTHDPTVIVKTARKMAEEKNRALIKDNNPEKIRLKQDLEDVARKSAWKLNKKVGGFYCVATQLNDNEKSYDVSFGISGKGGCMIKKFLAAESGVIMTSGFFGDFDENTETKVYHIKLSLGKLKEMADDAIYETYEKLYRSEYQEKNRDNSSGPVYIVRNRGVNGITEDGMKVFHCKNANDAFGRIREMVLSGRTFSFNPPQILNGRVFKLTSKQIELIHKEYLRNKGNLENFPNPVLNPIYAGRMLRTYPHRRMGRQ